MRIRSAVILLLIFPLFACAESAQEFMKKGVEFFLRGDYDSARQMFINVKDADPQTLGASAYYLGAIAANSGDDAAYKYFAAAIKSAPEEIKKSALLQYVKFAIANADWKGAISEVEANPKIADGDSQLAYLYADALYESGNKDGAKKALEKMLADGFEKKDSIGADMFADSFARGMPLAKSLDLSKLAASSPAAKARVEIASGRTVSQPQSEISLLAQAELAAQGGKIDAELLKSAAKEFRTSPFAWRAAFELAKIEYKNKNYASAEVYAKDAQMLAPPDIGLVYPVVMLRADALRLQKKYDDACHLYLKIAMSKECRGEPQAESLYKIGLCWYEQGEWGKAHAYFQRVFVGYFKFEYWGSRAYYYDARALYSLKLRRDANTTLVEYFRRAKDKNSQIYLEAKKFYDQI